MQKASKTSDYDAFAPDSKGFSMAPNPNPFEFNLYFTRLSGESKERASKVLPPGRFCHFFGGWQEYLMINLFISLLLGNYCP